jgi:dihydrofolate synthase/folylpolyglutamate synthase
MSYSELTDWMFNLERFGIKLGLENMTEFLGRIGDPHRDFRSVHVTGANGKGSTCVFTANILREHGLKVGLYTSPHLVDFRERIKLDGTDIPEDDVVRIGSALRGEMESMAREDSEAQLTFFEFTTGLAFKYFSEQKVDIAVVEVGMGGRLDATNVVSPEVTAITRIGLEHTNYLGRTIQEIAREKAGIVKDGIELVTCERDPEALAVIEGVCRRKGAPVRRLGRDFSVADIRQGLDGTGFGYSGETRHLGLRTKLLGEYQAENAATAIAIVESLGRRGVRVAEAEIASGIARTEWPGRLDVVSKEPFIMFDGSHNPDGIRRTVEVLRSLDVVPLTYVLGCMDDKDAEGIVKAIAPTAAKVIVTQVDFKRALPADRLAEVVRRNVHVPVEVVPDASDAIEAGLSGTLGKGLCAIGSLYLVGEAMRWRSHTGSAAPHKV